MATLLSKAFLVEQIEKWDTEWLLFFLAGHGGVALTYDNAQHQWTCVWTPENLTPCTATDDMPTAGSALQLLRQVALDGVEANYERWASQHQPD